MDNDVLLETNLEGFTPVTRGKVRDIYDLGDKLLIVTTDRISAYDCILPNGIPLKGKILNRISEFWFKNTESVINNHLITTNIEEFPHEFHEFSEQISGRSMLVEKAKPVPVECIVRGYISGSGWKEYKEKGSVCGLDLPGGLRESEKLNSPVFTPSTKASEGDHDVNITFEQVVELLGEPLAVKLRDISIKIYEKARDLALQKGIIIADTKFEFGVDMNTDELILIDELLTPDSSRFWLRSDYEPGRPQKSFDKQFVRDYLTSINWDKKPPAPSLPDEVVQQTKERYMSILEFFGLEL